MRAPAASLFAAGLLACFATTPALAAATGTVETGISSCAVSATGAARTCPDLVTVHVGVEGAASGQPGVVFIAILPLTDGQPTGYQGAYAHGGGWSMETIPVPYFQGTLPGNVDAKLPVTGGICARARQFTEADTFGVFAGYGVSPAGSLAAVPPEIQARTDALMAKAEASGDPNLIAFVREHFNNASSGKAAAGRAAAGAMQWMLDHKSVWQVATVSCP